jgi:hypothetical protein
MSWSISVSTLQLSASKDRRSFASERFVQPFGETLEFGLQSGELF